MNTTYADAVKTYGSTRKAAQALGIKKSTFFDNLQKERALIEGIQNAERPLISRVSGGKVKRYIFTCAVRGASVHTDFLDNLEAYANYCGAELVVGVLMSNVRQRYAEYDPEQFDPRVVPYVTTEPIEIGGKIRFSPELNLTATMVKPLQGLQTYTKRLWGIFPHTKIAVDTVATHKDRPTKFIATTGAVTHPSYSPSKAGFRAHFDHVHGAVIVEVSKDGVWFRHLTPTNEIDGTFYDLDVRVQAGQVMHDNPVQALVYGDIHVELLDPAVGKATWGYGSDDVSSSLVSKLQPDTQVFHDLMDMRAANYHELNNVFKRYERWYQGRNIVKDDFQSAMDFLAHVSVFSTNNIVVDSNHEYFIEKWLMKFDPARYEDFDNIDTFYRLKLAILANIRNGNTIPFLELLLREKFEDKDSQKVIDTFTFLNADDSYEIDNIECGWHGHRGANGSRGSKAAFKFVTEKAIVGHMHSPSIESGCHVVGTSSLMDLGYNKGPSSWAHTHCVIYPNGGRSLITMSDDRFWAAQGK